MTSVNSVLPTEILVRIFEHLPVSARARCSRLCKNWNTVLTQAKVTQSPVKLVVSCNTSKTLIGAFSPKLGFEDGECESDHWETFRLNIDQAVYFLSTFTSGKSVVLVVEQAFCLYQCLKVLREKWKHLEDVHVEYFGYSIRPFSFLATYYPDLSEMVTSLRLNSTVFAQSLSPILPWFTKLKSLYIMKERLVVDKQLISQLPTGLRVFWCKHFIFEENGLEMFLQRFGATLRGFAASLLSVEDVDLLAQASPNLHSLRLEHCTAQNPAALTSALAQFRRMKHFGLLNLVFLRAGLGYQRLFENWPLLESLHMPYPWSNGDSLTWLARQCCPKLSALHLSNQSSNDFATHLADMEPLRDQLTSIGVTIDDNTLPVLSECLEIFTKAKHFDLSPGKRCKQDLASSVKDMFASHAAKFPKKSFFVRWRENPKVYTCVPRKQAGENLFFVCAA